jgi:hypothetical protein
LCAEALALKPTPFDAAAIRAIQGYGLIKSNRAADGVAAIEEALTWWDRSNLRYTRSLFALWLAEGYLRAGDRLRSRATAETVLVTAGQLGYDHLQGVGRRLVGESMLPDDPSGAASVLEQAIEILGRVGALNELAKSFSLRSDAARLSGHPSQAEDFHRRSQGILAALGATATVATASLEPTSAQITPPGA